MARFVRAALTQTRNVYEPMPANIKELGLLADRLEDVRTANVEHHLELIAAAAQAGARVIGLGELFPAPYFALDRDEMWLDLAEDAREGPTVRALREAAQRHDMVIVAPIYELASGGKRFNTAVVIDAGGEALGSYRKTHIPEGTNERASFSETFYYEKSDGGMSNGRANISTNRFFPVFETAAGKVGVATCYDRHFEGVVCALKQGGAQMIFSPAVTFGAQSRRMWKLEFLVDAARHCVFIGGSNRLGAEAPWNVEYFGASYFAGPTGRQKELPAPRPELVLADLDLEQLESSDGSGWDLERDRRPEIYGA